MSEIKDITNLEAEQDSGLGSLKNYIPPNIRMFVSDLLGSKEPFTEKDLLESDKKLLKEIAIGGMDKGFIDYEDYGVNSIDRNILRNILDDRYNLKTLLGQAKVMLNEDGELIVKDTFDFNDASAGLSDEEQKAAIEKELSNIPKGNIKDRARVYARYHGSGPGEGAKVNFNINPETDEMDVPLSGRTLDNPWVKAAKGAVNLYNRFTD